MNHRSRRGLTVLGACGLIIGLIALSSSAVHAEKGANWMVNGKAVNATLLPEVVISEVEAKDISLSTEILKIKTEFLCTGALFIGAKLETEGTITNGNKTRFTGCITKLNGAVSPECEPQSALDG